MTKHHASCAIFDPISGPCDCGFQARNTKRTVAPSPAPVQPSDAAPVVAKAPVEAVPSDDGMIRIPRGLVGAACSAIDKKRDAPEVLKKLRRYTTGDLSAPQAQQVEEAAPAGGIYVGTISTGDIEGDEIDWDYEFDRKIVDALPQLRFPNQHYALFMAPIDGLKYAAQPTAQAAPASQVISSSTHVVRDEVFQQGRTA